MVKRMVQQHETPALVPQPWAPRRCTAGRTFIAAGNAKSVDIGEIGRDAFLGKFDDAIKADAI